MGNLPMACAAINAHGRLPSLPSGVGTSGRRHLRLPPGRPTSSRPGFAVRPYDPPPVRTAPTRGHHQHRDGRRWCRPATATAGLPVGTDRRVAVGLCVTRITGASNRTSDEVAPMQHVIPVANPRAEPMRCGSHRRCGCADRRTFASNRRPLKTTVASLPERCETRIISRQLLRRSRRLTVDQTEQSPARPDALAHHELRCPR